MCIISEGRPRPSAGVKSIEVRVQTQGQIDGFETFSDQ